ncbi:MAG: hypothetical protein EBU90_11895 [Proteobacteria bacterium]|nr:hypothetical protein [Pseudomonadota bacterium]NBP15364.1 hypothetical protein [bacterium]
MKKYNQFINEEASPRLPKSEDYWVGKGKIGKQVALYTHDDMDGIFSAIEVKKYLLNSGFQIVKYGIINYSEGWKYTTIDPKLINVVVDFANMPGDERDQYIDYYLDHHGSFTEFELDKYKSSPIQKKKTASAYEAICQNLGIPQDELTVSVIDMIDAAKYGEYDVDWSRLLDFNLAEIKKSDKVRLEFAAAFNQFLKRSDHKTLISVIHNCPDASIYSIFNVMKKVYPEHNVFPKTGRKKGFLSDSEWRLSQMAKRTKGQNVTKKKYLTQSKFLKDFMIGGSIKLDGYQIIGDLAFIPTGTWANALRARTIILNDFKSGLIEEEPKFILLQYGGTLQVCSYSKIDEIQNLPTYKNGSPINDLGVYMTSLLKNFQQHLGYYNPDTSLGQDEITVSGGHGGIGSISNIFGECQVNPYEGCRFIDMFKNKIISDLSGVQFGIKTHWNEPQENKSKEPNIDHKVLNVSDVTKLDQTGNVIKEGLSKTKVQRVISKFNQFRYGDLF